MTTNEKTMKIKQGKDSNKYTRQFPQQVGY